VTNNSHGKEEKKGLEELREEETGHEGQQEWSTKERLKFDCNPAGRDSPLH